MNDASRSPEASGQTSQGPWQRLPWDEPDFTWRLECVVKGLFAWRKQTKLWEARRDSSHSKSFLLKVNALLSPQAMAQMTSVNLPNGLKIIDYVHHRKKTFILICFGPPAKKKKVKSKLKELKPILERPS